MKKLAIPFALLIAVPVFAQNASATPNTPNQTAPSSTSSPSQPSPAPPMRVSGAIAVNMIDKKVEPSYPEKARKAHVEGAVIMQVVIDAEGQVTRPEVISGPDLLREAALAAVTQWRYRPFQLNGKPVPILTTITINFTINR